MTPRGELADELDAGLDPQLESRAAAPTTAIATKNFETFAHEIAARGGRSGLRVHVLPYPLNEQVREDVLKIGEAHFYSVLQTMGARLAAKDAA